MFLTDHNELEPPTMICPLLSTRDGRTPCMGETCALWYQSADEGYSGCSIFVGAFYACNTSYNTRQIKNVYRYR